MLFKKGSTGAGVVQIQEFLGLKADGVFGPQTKAAVVEWQKTQGLKPDGLVGPKTWAKMKAPSTDLSEKTHQAASGLSIEEYLLPKGEYKKGPTSKEYLFLHHTAGWHNPYRVIDYWDRDHSTIATEFVMGGQSVKNNNDDYDGLVLQALPAGTYAWHLGKNGSQHMHKHSIGIELCNFGYLTNGKTYAGVKAHSQQTVNLVQPFRGFKTWHRYSNKQIENLRQLILFTAERDSIDVRAGLAAEVKKHGAAAFEFNEDAYYGRIKGLWTHTNTRKDKFDMFPQLELLDMLLSL
jgi:hypothetical protein